MDDISNRKSILPFQKYVYLLFLSQSNLQVYSFAVYICVVIQHQRQSLMVYNSLVFLMDHTILNGYIFQSLKLLLNTKLKQEVVIFLNPRFAKK